jgi:hypothetical protein
MGCTFTELRHMHVPRATCASQWIVTFYLDPRQIQDLIISAYKLTRLGLPLTTLIFPRGQLGIKPAPQNVLFQQPTSD